MSNKPNWFILPVMRLHSTRAWVYREGQGWVFAELTPDELAEFRSYEYGVTLPRMRIRLPYGRPVSFLWGHIDGFANWFGYCTMTKIHPLAQARFHIQKLADDEYTRYRRIEPGSYGAWLWADEVQICRELECYVTVHDGWGWFHWGVPTKWKPPVQFKERIFIYAFVNEFTKEVYVGQTEKLERRWTEHLRDVKNAAKMALIESLRAQGHEPEPIQLEEVPGEKANERERYWTSYYKSQGYKIINQDYRSLV